MHVTPTCRKQQTNEGQDKYTKNIYMKNINRFFFENSQPLQEQ